LILIVTGPQLRRARRRLGLTQAQLAAQLDVHLVTVNRWEMDHVPVPKAVAMALPLLKPRRPRRIA
jgi:DNA-binding transcriptional regulator YiaG